MARYVSSGKTLATAANSNLFSVRSASQDRAGIAEIGIFTEAATALFLALFTTTVVDTAGTAVTPQKEDSGSGTSAVTCQTIPTGGTLNTVAIRRAYLPAVAGSAVIWTWPVKDELLVPLSQSLMVRNDGVIGPAITWYVVWED